MSAGKAAQTTNPMPSGKGPEREPAFRPSRADEGEVVTRHEPMPPQHVVDGWGNLWRYYGDTGYLRLTVTTEPGRTLADIVSETGTVTAMTLASPMILLREQVQRNGIR